MRCCPRCGSFSEPNPRRTCDGSNGAGCGRRPRKRGPPGLRSGRSRPAGAGSEVQPGDRVARTPTRGHGSSSRETRSARGSRSDFRTRPGTRSRETRRAPRSINRSCRPVCVSPRAAPEDPRSPAVRLVPTGGRPPKSATADAAPRRLAKVEQQGAPVRPGNPEPATERSKTVIAHIVLFNPKDSLSAADKRAFAQSIREAGREIGSIKRARVGRSVSVDPGYERSFGDKTYEYAAVIEFDDADGLIEYLRHPRHQELGSLFWRFCKSTAIVEVEMRSLDDELDDLMV